MSQENNSWTAGIRNIIFDLGGVVIDLDRERCVRAYERLGLVGAGEALGLYVQKDPFLGLEKGTVTASQFFDTMRPLCGGASDEAIAAAFNEFLVDLPASRLQRLRELRMAGFRVFALSNTNPVMFNSWIANAFRQEGGSINDYFDGVVASFQELTCKPDPLIFQILLRRYGLEPSQTLMLDDSEANCRAAAGCGIHALRVGSTPDDDMLAITSYFLQDNE